MEVYRILKNIMKKSMKIPLIKYLLRNIYYKMNYNTELSLIKNRYKNNNQHDSIIHFSMNKAATQYVKSILKKLGEYNGMVNVDYHSYAFKSNFPYLDTLSNKNFQKYKYLFQEKGYIYSVFGGMIEGIESLDKYKVILLVRDPRDALVSNYYSVAYSHPVPPTYSNKYEDFKKKREYARSVKIDEFVKFDLPRVKPILLRYNTLLIKKYSNFYLTKYEDMVVDFKALFDKLIEYCELGIKDDVYNSILKENKDLKPQKENINKHIRKGIAGDYKNKLKKETINYLNK